MSDLARPDGIEHRQIHEARGPFFRRWPLGLAGLGALTGAAFLDVYDADARVAQAANQVELAVEGPSRLRNGEFFEMLFTVGTQRNIQDLTVAVDETLWRDVTVNTLLPDPSEHGFREDAFEFRFGKLDAGDRLVVKIDGQINPDHLPSANAGTVTVGDGERAFVTVDFAMEVLP